MRSVQPDVEITRNAPIFVGFLQKVSSCGRMLNEPTSTHIGGGDAINSAQC